MFFIELSEQEETQANFAAEIREKLQAAYAIEKMFSDASLQKLADRLGVNKSVVYRQINGESNLTAKTISDLAWALNRVPSFDLRYKSTVTMGTTTNKEPLSGKKNSNIFNFSTSNNATKELPESNGITSRSRGFEAA